MILETEIISNQNNQSVRSLHNLVSLHLKDMIMNTAGLK